MGGKVHWAAATAAALLFALAGCGGQKTSWTFTGPETPPSLGGGLAGTLAPAERREAVAVALRGGPSARLLREAGYSLLGAAPWSQGASLTFALDRTIEVDADLPRADIPPDAPAKGTCVRPYRQTWLHERSSGVTRLYLLVDLKRRAVADVTTDALLGRLSWVRGKPHPDCQEIASG